LGNCAPGAGCGVSFNGTSRFVSLALREFSWGFFTGMVSS
jgi:hypothetical protein